MQTVTEFIEEVKENKDFLNKHKQELIVKKLLHPISRKGINAVFYVNTKVTYKGFYENFYNMYNIIKFI